MRRTTATLALAIIIVTMTGAVAFAEVEWSILNRLKLDTVPKDMAVTLDGRTLYVLTDKGDILIYNSDGALRDKISIGPHIDSIRIGQDGEQLYLISSKNKTVEAVQLDFVRRINTSGSPFKGPQEAPIVLVVFSDFQ